MAGGVLGLAGWGIWKRSQVVGGQADALPLPPAVEQISRQYIQQIVTQEAKPDGKLPGFTDLLDFFDATGWASGTITSGFNPNLVASLNGDLWPYGRLVQATSLNLACVINESENIGRSPPISPVGGPGSVFDFSRTTPFKQPVKGLKADLDLIAQYLEQKIPLPNSLPKG